jgi:hypothetical protein
MHKSVFYGFLMVTTLLAADTNLAFTDLPAAVQAAAKAEANGAEIVGASKEIEKDQTTYEVETKKDGKSRDLSYDLNGKLLEVEQQFDLYDIPAPAKAALQRMAAGGTIKKVESVTTGNSVSYEATVITRSGRHTEFAVTADGTRHHD